MNDIIVTAATAGMFTKVLVDGVKTLPQQTVGWVTLALAFCCGQTCSFLLAMSTDDNFTFTMKAVSTCVLVGILAFGVAVGVTELHKVAERRKEGSV